MPILLTPIRLEGPAKLDATKVPVPEQPAFEHIVHLLQHLDIHTVNFWMALQLYDACEGQINDFFQEMIRAATTSGKLDRSKLDAKGMNDRFSIFGGWQEIATRDAAMSIYHFGSILDGIKSSLSACPTLCAMVDHKNLRIAIGSLKSAFPNYKAIRHVVGHSADFSQSIAKRQQHSRKGPFKATVGQAGIEIKGSPDRLTQFIGNSAGRSYFVTLDGEVYGYELSRTSADRLKTIRGRVHESFEVATIPEPAS